MAEHIKKIRTLQGDLSIDYKALANKPDENLLDTTSKDLIGAINEVNQKAKNVPTKTSQLENDSGFLTKDDNVVVDLSEYSTTEQSDAKYQPKGDYSVVGHKHSEYLTEHQSLEDYAKKNELPTKTSQLANDSGYITSIPSEYITETELSGYAKTTQIPTKVSQLENDSKYLTSIPSEYVTETELENKKYLTSVPSEYITETELNNKGYLTQHQSLGDYAKKTELPTKISQLTNDSGYLTFIPNEYVTETELANKKYLTSVPSEYITESELNAKGYITSVPQEIAVQNNQPTESALWIDTDSSDYINLAEIDDNTVSTEKTWSSTKINELSREIVDLETEVNNKQPKGNYLTSIPSEYVTDSELTQELNKLTLGVHTDGLVYLFKNGEIKGSGVAMVGGESGDVIGNVDSSNNVILYGNLPQGDYNIKYEMEDGTLMDIGTLTLGGTDEPDEPQIENLFNIDTASLNTRIGSSGSTSSYNGMVTTDFIPVDSSMNGKFFYYNGVTCVMSTAYSYYARLVFYDENKTPQASTYQNLDTAPTKFDAWDTDMTVTKGYIRISMVIKDNVAITKDDVANLVITLE